MNRLRATALEAVRLLEAEYGRPEKRRRRALDVLVGTILSQNTSGVNSRRAFQSLRGAFPSWQALADARVSEIARAIRPAGLSRTKAPHIRAIVRRLLQERGKADLQFLEHMPRKKAMEYLLSLPGVGQKTASCVLLFAFGKPVLPVDTHVHRLSRRLGLVPDSASPEQTQGALERIVPPGRRHSFHVNLIAHGRSVCRPRPKCSQCVLLRLCPEGSGRRGAG